MNDSSVESQVAAFLAKYTPVIEAQLRDGRPRLRALFPRGFELCSDNFDAARFRLQPDRAALAGRRAVSVSRTLARRHEFIRMLRRETLEPGVQSRRGPVSRSIGLLVENSTSSVWFPTTC